MEYKDLPEAYRPITMWGYFGYEILFSIPIIGFICLIVTAFCSKNENKKNFAKSYFCLTIIVCVVALLIFGIALLTGSLDYLKGTI